MLIGATRNGETGAAGLVGTLGILSMGFVLQYVPFLQAQLAADDRFRAMFEWRRARRSFRRAPLLFWIALTFTLLLAIPPYLLKIEEVPQEIAWLFAAMVIGFVLPGRILAGWAIAKSNQRDDPKGIIRFGWRWLLRSLNIPVIFFYLFIVWGTQFTSWHGLQTWVQQHAIFVPAPFAGG